MRIDTSPEGVPARVAREVGLRVSVTELVRALVDLASEASLEGAEVRSLVRARLAGTSGGKR